jgi:formamidopyrimidine-DNA glycosylase
LGPEPLCLQSFHGDYLGSVCRGSRRAIKSVIMDGTVVVGVGNIYASEALYRAGVRPFRQAGAIAQRRLDGLVDGIRSVLRAAIAAGGTTLKDFQNVEGNPGYFRQELAVYGRAGAPCRRCSGTIVQRPLSSRATYWCPNCQR